ncbi:MAG: PqqD family protein [Acidimicrobiia bacterium]
MNRRPDLDHWEVDGESLLYDPATGRAHWLNGTATSVWELIDGSTSLEEIARLVSAAYDIELDQARLGVDTVVAGLEAQKLLGPPRQPAVLSEAPPCPRFLAVPPNQ